MIKRLLPLLLLLFVLPLKAGTIKTESIYSQILGTTVQYNVYLPDGFDRTDAHYPAVYLLHGLSDDYDAWHTKGRMEWVADELIRSGEVRPMVVIMPNAGGPDVHHTWNGYFNMPGWRYEDFFFGELIPAVEEKFRCGGCKEQRAVMGLSMGGGGSVVYAQRHPEAFSSCYAMSAWLDNKAEEVGTDVPEKDCLYYVGVAVRERSALDFVDAADENTLQALRSVAWFIDCGDNDFLLDLNLSLYQKMRNRGVKCELRVRDGIHNWEYWHLALRMALPFASRNMGK